MSAFEFSKEHNAFVKQCSRCEKVFIGTQLQDESEVIFFKSFPYAPSKAWGSAMHDGFHSTCRACNHYSGRLRLGMAEHNIFQMYKEQEGKCSFCCIEIAEPETSGKGNPLRACVDHCHKTGRVRGLLCNDCNVMLGHYERVRNRTKSIHIHEFEDYLEETEAA